VGRKDWGGVLRDKADDVAALVETIDGQLRDPAFVSQVHAKADCGWGVSRPPGRPRKAAKRPVAGAVRAKEAALGAGASAGG